MMPERACCRLFSLMALAFLWLPMVGCPKAMPYRPQIKSLDSIMQNLAREGSRRSQVKGTFWAKATGIKRLLGSIELDVVAQAQDKLYISQRSFFNQPARVLSTDGAQVYVLELGDVQAPKYAVHGVDRESLEEFLELPLAPFEVVQVLLGVAPVEGAQPVELKETGPDTYQLRLRQPSGMETQIVARAADDVLLERALFDLQGKQIYRVHYQDFRVLEGVEFAHRFEFEVNLKGRTHGVILGASDIVLGGELLGIETFRIEEP
jgi:hypothetical protein